MHQSNARALLASALLTLALPGAGRAQHEHVEPAKSAPTLRTGAHGVALLTRVSPILAGESATEAYLTQPSLMADLSLAGGRLRAHMTLSLEPLTLDRGELGAGTYGEGYVDRRHPHTYAHEAMLTALGDVGPVNASLAVGRGFVPFGTDDPMMRPFVKFPVNHHLGQILERLVGVAGVRAGPVMVEAALFNGDEPFTASDLGSFDRFGDSWAGRVTLMPVRGLELQGSRAWVVSPELPFGGGLDQRKWSASARLARSFGATNVYALAEWKRTTATATSNDTSRRRDTDGNRSPDARSASVTCAASASDATLVMPSVTLRASAAMAARPRPGKTKTLFPWPTR
jgi:hypothetical protein